MRKFFLTATLAILATVLAYPCTNLLVGRLASTDGSTIVSYSADSYDLYGVLLHRPAGQHAPGTMITVHEWINNTYRGQIPQVAQTYNVIGNMNEHQLTIAESTFGGREELRNTEGQLDYGNAIWLTLQRTKTAREAITTLTNLLNTYGYNRSGESISIADPNEVWVLELIGKGPDRKGVVWVAVRIPDDAVSAHANQARIHQFPLNDPEKAMYSPDVISFAREKGYFDGRDEDFSFTKAYSPAGFRERRFCEARVWSFFNRISSGMDKHLPYIFGESDTPMPLYVIPDRKLSVQDIQHYMRDLYEDTPFDWRFDITAGPFNSPYRWAPLNYEVDGVDYFNERPIATQQSGWVFVAQMRSWLPGSIGGVIWWGVDDATGTVFYPFYGGHTEVPHEMAEGNGDLLTFSWTSAFWMHNWVMNQVYNRWSDMIVDVRRVQSKLEDSFFAAQPEIEKKALALYENSPEEAVTFLTQYTNNLVKDGVQEWKRLGEFLLIKYLDGTIKQEENGVFLRNEKGVHAPVNRAGYPKEWSRKVLPITGDRYRIPVK
jgi:dipeptidase